MDRNSIIQSARGHEEEKVGFSLKLPKGLKDQLQEVSDKEKVSMNALIVATLQAMIDDKCGKELKQAKRLLLDYRKMIEPKLNHYEMYGPQDFDDQMECDNLTSTYSQINKLLGI